MQRGTDSGGNRAVGRVGLDPTYMEFSRGRRDEKQHERQHCRRLGEHYVKTAKPVNPTSRKTTNLSKFLGRARRESMRGQTTSAQSTNI